jgi:hypothetical protein
MKANYQSDGVISLERSRVADYLTLTKPELTFLSILTAVAGAYLGGEHNLPVASILLVHVFIGTLLVGSGAGTLNQYIERNYDALMKRTENRPLPSGRLSEGEALLFGVRSSAALRIRVIRICRRQRPWCSDALQLSLSVHAAETNWYSTITEAPRRAPCDGMGGCSGELSVEPGILF